MLNRFQFARLRGLRRGARKTSGEEPARSVTDRVGSSSRDGGRVDGGRVDGGRVDGGRVDGGRVDGGRAAGAAPSGGDVRDAWEDDDRVGRLLARRAAEQEAERRSAMERLGGGSSATQTVDGAGSAPNSAPGTHAPDTHSPGTSSPDESSPGHPLTGSQPSAAPAAARRAAARTTTVPALKARPADSGVAAPADPRTGIAAPTRTTPAGHGAPASNGSAVAPAGPAGLGTESPPAKVRRDRGARTGVVAAPGSARVVCIASGKGGTGKSVVATNLALQRAQRGERVLLVDFDAGLANDHLLLGLAPPYDIGHVMTGEVSARDALVEGPLGIKLLAGGVGRQVMIDPTRRELDRLFKALKPLESEFDLILVDHGAGLSYSTVAHLAATSTLILVTNHEVTALSDGYALYKRAHMVNHAVRVGLVINRVPDERIALGAWERFRSAAHKFLGHTPEFIGWVPVDPAVPQAVQMRAPATISFPDSAAVEALERVAAWGPIDHARSATAFYDRARRALR